MLRALICILSVAALCCCRGEGRAQAEGRAELSRSRENVAQHALGKRIAREIVLARRHLDQELTPAAGAERVRCADDTLVRTAEQMLLVVRVRDVRREQRELLPLEFSASLASDDFSGVIPHLASGRAALWDAGEAKPKSRADADAALAALVALGKRRYRAELQVEGFAAPRVFRRKDQPRSEWAPGSLSGRLVVADLLEQRALCQTPVVVRGDARDAPISRRLRESTRAKLLDALNVRVWAEMGRALSSLSSVLVLPKTNARDSAEHRWAMAPELTKPSSRRR